MDATSGQLQRIFALAYIARDLQQKLLMTLACLSQRSAESSGATPRLAQLELRELEILGRKTIRDDRKLLRNSLRDPRLTVIDLNGEDLPISVRTV